MITLWTLLDYKKFTILNFGTLEHSNNTQIIIVCSDVVKNLKIVYKKF